MVFFPLHESFKNKPNIPLLFSFLTHSLSLFLSFLSAPVRSLLIPFRSRLLFAHLTDCSWSSFRLSSIISWWYVCVSFLLLLIFSLSNSFQLCQLSFFAYFFLSCRIFVRLFICHLPLSPLFLFHSVNCINVCVCVFVFLHINWLQPEVWLSFSNWYMLSTHYICIKRCAHLQQFVFFGIFFVPCFHCEHQRVFGCCRWFFLYPTSVVWLVHWIPWQVWFFFVQKKKIAYLKGKNLKSV